MIKILKYTLCLVLLIVYTLQLEAQTGNRSLYKEQLIPMMESSNISGLSAIIVKDGKEIWSCNLGLADRETGVSINDSTVFLLYSITKTFTGIGLMQLYEDGKFDLDDPINRYLPFKVLHPEYPEADITFRMLMMHTSSIRDNWNTIDKVMTFDKEHESDFGRFLKDYLSTEGEYYDSADSFTKNIPGTKFSYSNVGATLAGYLIEQLSGIHYTQYITNNILIPLGMHNSGFNRFASTCSNLAVEYAFEDDIYIRVGHRNAPLTPAGFLYTTAEDLAIYLKALINNCSSGETEILSKELFADMIREQDHKSAPNSGLFFGYDHINKLWGHTGGFRGVKTLMFFDKENDWGLVLLTNGAGQPWDIIFRLYDYARNY